MDNMSLSDIAAVIRGNDNDGWGQGGAWWIIILFLFVFMGGAESTVSNLAVTVTKL